MATLFESLGHTTWVTLREAVGSPVPEVLRDLPPRPARTALRGKPQLSAVRKPVSLVKPPFCLHHGEGDHWSSECDSIPSIDAANRASAAEAMRRIHAASTR